MTKNFDYVNVRNLTIDDIVERMNRLCRDLPPVEVARRSRSSIDPILGSSSASTSRIGYYSSAGSTWTSLTWTNLASLPSPTLAPSASAHDSVPGTSSNVPAFLTSYIPGTTPRAITGIRHDPSVRDPLPGTSRDGQPPVISPTSINDTSPRTSNDPSSGPSCSSSSISSYKPMPRKITGRSYALLPPPTPTPTDNPLPSTTSNPLPSPRSISDASPRTSNDPSSGPSCSSSSAASYDPSPRSTTGQPFAQPLLPTPRPTSNPLPRSINGPPVGSADRRCTFYPEFKKPSNLDPVEFNLGHVPPACERNEPATGSQPSPSDVNMSPFIRAQIYGFSGGDGNAENQSSRWTLYPGCMRLPREAPLLRNPLGLSYGRVPRSVHYREYMLSELATQKEKSDYERDNTEVNKETSENNDALGHSASEAPAPLKFKSEQYRKPDKKDPKKCQKVDRSDNAGKNKRRRYKRNTNKKKNENTNYTQ